MKARVYYSSNNVLQFALEEIFIKFTEDFFIGDYDFIFFSISPYYDDDDVNTDIKKIFQTDRFIAFNALSSFGNQHLVKKGVSALFVKFEKDESYFDIMCCKCKTQKKEKLYSYLKDKQKCLNLLITTLDKDIVGFLENFKSPSDLIGGVVTGEDGKIFCNDEIIDKGFVVISLCNVEYDYAVATGYKPIGPTYEVKLAKGSNLYVVDYSDMSVITKRLMRGIESIRDLWFSPLLIQRGGYYVPRTFRNIKDNLYVEFYGNFKKGDKVRISYANKELLLEEDRAQAREVKRRLKTIDLVFSFSCMARQHVLSNYTLQELKTLNSIINAPLFGFFTHGEILINRHNSLFFNQTTLIVGVRE
ncbi:MAG: hypothetical protein GXO62_00735 [Epsilonproteobacteria bacterium]|nr:hypothetical protein [Campylobacterota bacterium]